MGLIADCSWGDHPVLSPSEDDEHVKEVGLILSRVAADSLLAWEPAYERIIAARFASKCQNMSKIDNNNTELETVMGQHGLGSMDENGEILADFCTSNDIVI